LTALLAIRQAHDALFPLELGLGGSLNQSQHVLVSPTPADGAFLIANFGLQQGFNLAQCFGVFAIRLGLVLGLQQLVDQLAMTRQDCPPNHESVYRYEAEFSRLPVDAVTGPYYGAPILARFDTLGIGVRVPPH